MLILHNSPLSIFKMFIKLIGLCVLKFNLWEKSLLESCYDQRKIRWKTFVMRDAGAYGLSWGCSRRKSSPFVRTWQAWKTEHGQNLFLPCSCRSQRIIDTQHQSALSCAKKFIFAHILTSQQLHKSDSQTSVMLLTTLWS